jgi:arylesterase/paraoxonase
MAIDRAARRVFVSSDDRAAGGAAKRGAVFLMPLDGFEDAPARVDVTQNSPTRFHPHGVSLWTGPDGRQVLYVVNHPLGGDPKTYSSVVEIYDVDPGGLLTHRASVESAKHRRINDVAATGPDSFYASIESIHRNGSAMEALASLTTDSSGGVVFWEKGQFRLAAFDVDFGNGLALSPDGGTLYVAASFGREMRIYARDPATNALSLRERVYLGAAPDNIDVDAQGRVWITAHPKIAAFMKHAGDPKNARSPSQVFLFEPDPSGKGGDVSQVYLSDGAQLSGASIAVADSDRMILGSVFDPDALVCVLPKDFRQPAKHRFIAVD